MEEGGMVEAVGMEGGLPPLTSQKPPLAPKIEYFACPNLPDRS